MAGGEIELGDRYLGKILKQKYLGEALHLKPKT